MKKLLAGIFLALLFSVNTMADFTQHPRYANKIEPLLLSMIQSISDAQALYFIEHDAYFQGLIVPSEIQDGLSDSGVNWAVAPSDQTDTWKDFAPGIFKQSLKIPFQMRVDVYQSPAGWGWILRIDVYIAGFDPDKYGNDGDHWIYVHSEGPASPPFFRYDEWYIVP